MIRSDSRAARQARHTNDHGVWHHPPAELTAKAVVVVVVVMALDVKYLVNAVMIMRSVMLVSVLVQLVNAVVRVVAQNVSK